MLHYRETDHVPKYNNRDARERSLKTVKSIKPGRGPSMMSGVGGIAAAIFGLLWTIGAASIGAPVFMTLFGVVFIVVALISVFYNLHNATSENRMSAFEITEDGDETDPLNKAFGAVKETTQTAEGSKFCPYCGQPVQDDFEFCNNCGKKLPG